MPTCQSCGGWVSKDYLKVFAADADKPPEGCPDCQTRSEARGSPYR